MSVTSQQSNAQASDYSVNQAVGYSTGVGWIPANQFVYWVVILIPILTLQNLLSNTPLQFSLQSGLIVWVIFCGTFWVLTGSKEHEFLDKFDALPLFATTWIQGEARIKWTRAGLPLKERIGNIGKWWQKLWRKTEVYTPIEDLSDLVCYGQINLMSYQVGFYWLKNKQGQDRIIFKWHGQGEHPETNEAEARNTLDAWNEGVLEFPPGEEITVEQRSFANDEERQAEIDELLARSTNPLDQALLYSQKARTRQLTRRGLRKVKTLSVTATYTPSRSLHEDRDPISRILKGIAGFWSAFWEIFSGQKEEMNHQRMEKLLNRAFEEGFLSYNTIFTDRMKLQALPYTGLEMWGSDYAEYHQSEAPPIPQLLVLDENGLRTEVNDPDLHTAAVLFQGDRGRSSVPITKPEWVYLPASEKYVGFMQLGKPKDYVSAHNQMRYLWKLLARERIYDCRIVTQFTVGNVALEKFNLERSTRYSAKVAAKAMEGSNVDVAAEDRVRESVQARRALHRGEHVIKVAAGVFLYRNNPQALDRDFAYVRDRLPSGEPYRERNIVPRLWRQSMPYVWEGFLQRPRDRRDEYSSFNATGQLNLASTAVLDKGGIELVSLEGGTPIYINPFDPENHLRIGIFAKSRVGKSVFQGEYGTQCYLHRQPIIGFDYPRPTDGTSTYYDLVESIKACGGKAEYYDSGSKSNNVLHKYDFSGLPNAKEREEGLMDLQVRITIALGMAGLDDPLVEQAMFSIVVQSLNDFYAQPNIRDRFKEANQAGIGTPQWKQSPTYHDYVKFLSPWLVNYYQENAATLTTRSREAGGMLLEQLRACLKSKLGRAIAQPSDFDNDADVVIFALRGMDTDYTARIMALSGYAALLARALNAEVSHFLTDESPILFKYPAISNLIGELIANGGKWGVRIVLSGQEAEIIYASAAGPQILQGLNLKIIGQIEEEAKDSIANRLKIAPEILEKWCTQKNFRPSSAHLRSHWVVKSDKTYIPCGYYPSELLLGVLANNVPEAAARKRVRALYPDTPEGVVRGLLDFSKRYAAARKSGTPMSEICPEPDRHLRAVS